MRRPQPILQTARHRLRLAQPADVPALVRYFSNNTEHFARTDPPRPAEFLSAGYWQVQVRSAAREFEEDKSLRLLLFDHSEAEVLGTVNFTQFLRGPLHACYLGYGLAEAAQGQGRMTEALQVSIAYVFKDLNLHRIMANHLPDNARSAAVLQRLGFRVEGLARDYLFIRGAWRDHVLNALANPDWRAGV